MQKLGSGFTSLSNISLILYLWYKSRKVELTYSFCMWITPIHVRVNELSHAFNKKVYSARAVDNPYLGFLTSSPLLSSSSSGWEFLSLVLNTVRNFESNSLGFAVTLKVQCTNANNEQFAEEEKYIV